MKVQELIKEGERYLCNTYRRYPILFVRGEGIRVWDEEGKEYLDFISGLAVCNLGHCHPRVVKAISEQCKLLLHTSNLYHTKPQIELARLLVENSFASKVFFANSGAEANEAAIKLTRKCTKDHRRKDSFEIITMNHSFHGRTIATITATGQKRFHKGFEPLPPGFKYVPFNNLEAVEKAITRSTCAIMVEPIQGEGGVNCPSKDYLRGLRQICDANELLLIFDEIQVGIGRTGKLFAYENYGVTPDIITLAKALASGLPIGAMLAKEEIAQSFSPGTHASTFGGNPVVTSAGVATISTILEEGILANCQRVGEYLFKGLEELKEKYPFIKEVRGKGLIIGMKLKIEGEPIVHECLKRRILINCTMERILRFLPPLIVTEREIDILLSALDEIFQKI